jgi:hypothetical protein
MQAWVEALKGQGTPSGVPWVDAVSATVRPFLTYYWCVGLYGGAKLLQMIVAVQAHTPLAQLVPILTTEYDQSVISSMLAFWFVDRALRKITGK